MSQPLPECVPAVLELIATHAASRPDDIAVQHLSVGQPAREITWADLLKASRAAGAKLMRAHPDGGFAPAYLGKSIEGIAWMLGAIAIGKVYAGVSPKFRLPQLLHVLNACDAGFGLVDSVGLPVVQEGLAASAMMRNTNWLLVDSSGTSPRSRAAAQAIRIEGSLQAVNDLDGEAVDGPFSPLDPRRAAVCLFTSGSTGAPKGVLVAWEDLFRRAAAECQLFNLTHQDRLLSLLPFSFDVGLNQLMSALVSGARLVILDSWMPQDILQVIATQGITGVSGVPSIWLSLLKARRVPDRSKEHASLRYLTVSGGDMEPELLRSFAAMTSGVGIFKTYGQTESFRSTALRPEELSERPASVGRAFGGARVYVVRPDGSRANVGERGEVVHTGLGVMLGYLRGTGVDDKRRLNPFFGPDDPSAHAIFTGDQGHLDAEGFLYLAGRQDDMVKLAGHRVHLSELAAEMTNVPGVLAAEAVSVPVEGDDPLLAVFVLADTGHTDWTDDRLHREAARRLPSYMRPRLIELRRSFPLTASGKPDRQALRAEAAELLKTA